MTALDVIRNLGLIVIPFTLYFSWTKIGFRVIAQQTWSSRRNTASGISRLTLINMKDRSLAIFHAYATYDDTVVPLISFDPPLILKSYEAANIEIPEVSEYYIGKEIFKFDAKTALDKVDIILSTSSKIIKCKRGAPPSHVAFAYKNNKSLVTIYKKSFNDRVYNSNVKYAIGYRLDGTEHTTFINQSGYIDWKFEPNMLRSTDIASEETVRSALDASGIKHVIGHYYVQTLEHHN